MNNDYDAIDNLVHLTYETCNLISTVINAFEDDKFADDFWYAADDSSYTMPDDIRAVCESYGYDNDYVQQMIDKGYAIFRS